MKKTYSIGIYEKAMPDQLSWPARFDLAKKAGYDFIEISIDESNWRLDRLNWNPEKRKEIKTLSNQTDVQLNSICLSAHRRFPLGSADANTREHSFDLLRKSVDLALDLGIKIILVPGYDVFYEESTIESERLFIEGLAKAAELAAEAEIIMALENTDKYLISIHQAMKLIDDLQSPWFELYGDVGNLIACGLDVLSELEAGIGRYVGLHIKDTKPGVFRNVPLGEGDVPFIEVFLKLAEINFQGPIMLELWNDPERDPHEYIQSAHDWIQGIIHQNSDTYPLSRKSI